MRKPTKSNQLARPDGLTVKPLVVIVGGRTCSVEFVHQLRVEGRTEFVHADLSTAKLTVSTEDLGATPDAELQARVGRVISHAVAAANAQPKRELRFRLGPWTYRLSFSDEIINDDGERVFGRCYWQERQVVLDASLSSELRVEVLLRELWCAWHRHLGISMDGGEASLTLSIAAFAVDVMRQLNAQGGEAALGGASTGKGADHA